MNPNFSTPNNNVVTTVVEHGLCSGCGVCVGACPNKALTIGYLPNGDLAAQPSGNPCLSKCTICTSICPFAEGVLNPRQLNQAIFGPSESMAHPEFHEDVGYYQGTFVGYSKAHRATSASGGLLIWTLESLLISGEIDCVAAVTCATGKDGRYTFTFTTAQTVDELRQCSGSTYHQVEISTIVERILDEPKRRWAITGVPCLCAALRKAMGRLPKLRRSITYLFGLACGMYQNRFYTEMLLAAADVSPTEAKSINYRGKARTLSAGNFTFQVTGQNGPIGKVIDYKGLPFYLGQHAFFRINACNYCMDVFAEAADACYMDAWLPEYQADLRGNSLVLVRNPAIRSLFEDARTGGPLTIDSISIAKVVQSQKGHVHRKREAISMRMGTKETVPGRDNHHGFMQRSAWWLQKRTQERSKRAWARYGRYGRTVFWLAMLDLLMLQETLDWTSRIARMPQRLWRKVHTFTRG